MHNIVKFTVSTPKNITYTWCIDNSITDSAKKLRLCRIPSHDKSHATDTGYALFVDIVPSDC